MISARRKRAVAVLESGPVALGLSLLFAGAVALSFAIAWHPRLSFYSYNVPIAVPFAAFVLERATAGRQDGIGPQLLDVAVLALALLRVVAPPLPYVSGHTLFATHAGISARGWPLRATAIAVMLQVIYVKLFVMGGWESMVGGLLIAVITGVLRRRLARPPRPDPG